MREFFIQSLISLKWNVDYRNNRSVSLIRLSISRRRVPDVSYRFLGNIMGVFRKNRRKRRILHHIYVGNVAITQLVPQRGAKFIYTVLRVNLRDSKVVQTSRFTRIICTKSFCFLSPPYLISLLLEIFIRSQIHTMSRELHRTFFYPSMHRSIRNLLLCRKNFAPLESTEILYLYNLHQGIHIQSIMIT